MPERPSITDLENLVAALPTEEQARFARLFHVSTTIGTLNPPPSMEPWIEKFFGSVDAVRSQKIVKVTNLVTWEGALFNELRARRPMEAKGTDDLQKLILENVGDPFCQPLEGTPADSFGRVQGAHTITASNIAKYDGYHGVAIFDEHDPLAFTATGISDALDTALAWAHKAHAEDERARYFFLMWNCLWKSGASIIHGHVQMTLTRDMHYAKVEHLRRAALAYRAQHGTNYFDDLYSVHQSLGLGFALPGIRILAYLTPIKEKETLILGQALDETLKATIYHVLRTLVDRLGVTSFNLALYLPPLVPVEGEDWSGFPILVRLVDRGDPNNKTADVGAMELYAASVIVSDPFRVAETLRWRVVTPHRFWIQRV
jgi:hypothetical protein